MNVKIKKFKVTKTNKISISYDFYNKKAETWDEYSLICSDNPRPELTLALAKLSIHVVDMCELPENYSNRIKVTGVSFSYGGEEEVMGAVLISQMDLENSNTSLNLNTPHKASGSYNDQEPDPMQVLSGDCVDDLLVLCEEIEKYIKGERAQLSLFPLHE